MRIEWLLALLPWLALLACPLVMFWMMRGMRGSCGKQHASGGIGTQGASTVDGHAIDADAEMAQLRARLARLEAHRTDTPAVEVHR